MYAPDKPEESEVVLRALKELTPSSQGSIERIELRGQVIGPRSTPLILTRDSRKRVASTIRSKSLEPESIEQVGRIRELDKDRLSFELREIGNTSRAQTFVFDANLWDQVMLALDGDGHVKVTGMTFPVKNIAYALAISRFDSEPV